MSESSSFPDESSQISRGELRNLLNTALLSDDDFMAFVSDNFNDIFKKYSSSMNRTAKTTLLLEEAVSIGLIYKRLQQQYPDRVQFIEIGRAKEQAALASSNVSYNITNNGNMYSLEIKAQFGSLKWEEINEMTSAFNRIFEDRIFLASAQEGSIRLILICEHSLDVNLINSVFGKLPQEATIKKIDLSQNPDYRVIRADGKINEEFLDRLLEGNAYFLSKWAALWQAKHIREMDIPQIDHVMSELDSRMRNLRIWIEVGQVTVSNYVDALRRERPQKIEKMTVIEEQYRRQNEMLEGIRNELDSIKALLKLLAK